MNVTRLIVVGLVTLAWSAIARGEEPAPTFECRWTDKPITVDGKADEEVWASAQTIDKFRRAWEGDKERPPKQPTKARLLWDREYIYFFAELQDADLNAVVKDHDGQVWTDDAFELFFKPAADKTAYYEFNFNPLNTVMDMLLPKRGDGGWDRFRADGEFEIQSAVSVNGTISKTGDKDTSWAVEGRIAWKSFSRTGGRPEPGATWGFAPCRVDITQGEEEPEYSSGAALKSKAVADFHLYEDYASLKFLGAKESGAKPQAAGMGKFAPLVTSKVLGSPDAPKPYRMVRAFPKLTAQFPVVVAHQPGSDRLWAVTQPAPYGACEIIRFVDDPNVDRSETLMPFFGIVYSIAFHPDFANNGYVYMGRNGPSGAPMRTAQVVRYRVDPKPPYAVDLKSETVIIEWESAGHDGLAMAFAPDGNLFLTTGDGTSDSDKWMTGQDLSRLQAKVLRINIDHPDPGKQYSVPKDNPFVGQENVRPETWAYGMRNPWRMDLDRKTGNLWVGQNGQDNWEQVYLIEKGANCGWSAYEGSHPFYPNRKGPHPIQKPIAEHPHSEARSLTGGIVYYGSAFPKLVGAYLYGDYSTGKIWAIRVNDQRQVIYHEEIADTTAQITSFATDSKGELILSDSGGHRFFRLEPVPADVPRPEFPKTLSASGLFKDVTKHAMADGVIPYSVNAELWSDGAYKERFIAIPAKPGGDRRIGYTNKGGWEFPDETVIVKSFALEREAGNPASRHWIETRFFTRQEGEWAGYSYLWNDEQTDATLVESSGRDRGFKIRDASVAGGERKLQWHYPSRTECMVCHTRQANFVLGLQTLQMNRDHDYASVGGGVKNQLAALEYHGLFRVSNEAGKNSSLLPTSPVTQPRMPNPHDTSASVDSRARAYLHANCANCHIESGGGNSLIELEFTRPRETMNLFDAGPLHDNFDIAGGKLIASGSPDQSILLRRIMARQIEGQPGQMPPLATNVGDEAAIKLIRQWIAEMPPSVKSAAATP
jgi:uncharacterized repeat protein (TIGR03806 family)